MSANGVGFQWLEILLMLLSGGGLVGLPPGDRDPALLKAAPQQSLVFVEWAARGPGKPGARGIDGFVADPEIKALIASIEKGLKPEITEQEDSPSDQRDALRLMMLVTNHSGCLFAYADPPAPQKGLLSVLAPVQALSQFHVGLVIDAGSDVSAIIDALNRATHQEVPAQPRMFEIAGPKGTRLQVHLDGDRLLIGLGAGTIERMMVGLKGQGRGLDANPRFTEAFKRVASDRMGQVTWLDLKGAADVAVQTLGPAGLLLQTALKGAGADALEYLVSGTGVVDGTVIQRTFVATGGRTDGVLMLAKAPALRPEQFSHIPADSDIVLATSLDLERVVFGVRELLAKTNPLTVKVFDEAVRELETELGMSLGQEVFPAFGNAWTAFNSPSEGGLLGSNLIVAIEVRDPAKAQGIFERLMRLIEQSVTTDLDTEFGITAALKRHDFLGHTIHYVNRTGGTFGPTLSASPAFCLTRSHILFAMHPQALKSHLRYSAQPQPSIDLARKLSLPQDELLTAAYLNGVSATRILSSLAPYLGQSITELAEVNGIKFDQFAIPSPAALIPYTGDVTFSITRQRDGIMLESRNPQIGSALITAVSSAKSIFRGEYEMLLEAKRQKLQPVDHGGLGAPEGQVIPAAAVKPPEQPQEPAAAAAARRLTPLMLKALVPDGIQPLIPDDVFKKLAEPPSPETLKQREERRKQLEQRRLERQQRRKGLPVPPQPQPF